VTRDELLAGLEEEGIQTKRYFHPPLHQQTLYRDLGLTRNGGLSVSEAVSASSLALPLYSHMSVEAVDEIRDRILDICAGKREGGLSL